MTGLCITLSNHFSFHYTIILKNYTFLTIQKEKWWNYLTTTNNIKSPSLLPSFFHASWPALAFFTRNGHSYSKLLWTKYDFWHLWIYFTIEAYEVFVYFGQVRFQSEVGWLKSNGNIKSYQSRNLWLKSDLAKSYLLKMLASAHTVSVVFLRALGYYALWVITRSIIVTFYDTYYALWVTTRR